MQTETVAVETIEVTKDFLLAVEDFMYYVNAGTGPEGVFNLNDEVGAQAFKNYQKVSETYRNDPISER